jgi:hypothetical protein
MSCIGTQVTAVLQSAGRVAEDVQHHLIWRLFLSPPQLSVKVYTRLST